jgi:hypothetical protein
MPTAAMDIGGSGQVEVTGDTAIEVIDLLRQVDCVIAARRVEGRSGEVSLRLALDGLEASRDALWRRGRRKR